MVPFLAKLLSDAHLSRVTVGRIQVNNIDGWMKSTFQSRHKWPPKAAGPFPQPSLLDNFSAAVSESFQHLIQLNSFEQKSFTRCIF